jgi:hypothetical protein
VFETPLFGNRVSKAPPPASSVQVSTIYVNAHIETMNSTGASAQAVAIKDGKFVGVGSTVEILAQVSQPAHCRFKWRNRVAGIH